MIPALLGLPGKMKTVLDRLTSTRAAALDNLDLALSTRAPASTALSNVTWSDGLATALASTLVLDRCQMLSWSSSATGGTQATADLTIAAVDTTKAFVIPLGTVNTNSFNGVAAGFELSLLNATTVRLQFKVPGTGTVGYSFKAALVSFA